MAEPAIFEAEKWDRGILDDRARENVVVPGDGMEAVAVHPRPDADAARDTGFFHVETVGFPGGEPRNPMAGGAR